MLIATVIAPYALLSTWLVLGALVLGNGLLVRRALRLSRVLDGDALFAAFWLGIATLTLGLQLWHLFAPITPLVAAGVGAAGLAGLGVGLRDLACPWPGRIRMRWVPPALLLLWWLGNRGLGEVAAFDTTMYHIPAIEWLRAHAIVPGLANLHGRFGFNNASFLLAALLDASPWRDGSVYLLNGVLACAALARGAQAGLRWSEARDGARAAAAVDLVLLLPTIGIVMTPVLFRGLNADVPAAFALFAGVSLVAGRVARMDPGDRAGREAQVAAAATLATAVAFKLSVALVALPAWLLAVAPLAQNGGRGSDRRVPIPAIVLSVALIATWLVRGVLLSGYPLYPATVLPFPVEWRVPVEQAAAEHAWIRFFAWTWHTPGLYNVVETAYLCRPLTLLGAWVRALFRLDVLWQVALPAGLTLCFIGLSLRSLAGPRTRIRLALWLALLVPASVAWLVLVPRPLFGLSTFWSLAAVAGALFALGGPDTDRPGRPAAVRPVPAVRFGLALLTFALVTLAGNARQAARTAEADYVRAALDVLVTRPAVDTWLVPSRWHFPAMPYVTDSGLRLLVPTGHRCGRAPLPCTSHPAPNLRLRRPDDRSAGFMVDGAWQAERFPSPVTNFMRIWRAVRSDRTPCGA